MIKVDKRIDYIDYAKAIGIILVVIGHINAYNASCKVWLYAFHMPLFFLLSGMFLKPIKDFRTFIVKRSKRLLVPYVVWGLIFAPFSLKNLLCICYGSHQTLCMAETQSLLWFFPVLFLAYIIGEVIIIAVDRCKRRKIFLKILGGVVAILIGLLLPKLKYGYPFCMDIAFVAVGFMMIGRCVFDIFMKARSMTNIKLLIVTCLLGVMTMGAFLNIPTAGNVNMAEAVYGNPILFLLSATIGSSFVICLSIFIERMNLGIVNRWLLYIGQNSLAIMLLHVPAITVFVKVLQKTTLPDGICLLAVTLVTIVICCVGIMILNAFVPQIVGKDEK